MKQVRLGCGAGYSGDRIEPALELAEQGELDYLIFECLAERTIAINQLAKLADPQQGYDALIKARMEAVLPVCYERGVKIITNMGAANPVAAGAIVRQTASDLGLNGLKIGIVLGDDICEQIKSGRVALLRAERVPLPVDRLISANVYLGATPIVEALEQGAEVVITGRVADPSLFLAPMRFELGWAPNDWDRMGFATVIAHLLECAGLVTGGFFADPGYKEVANPAHLGFPIAEVYEDGLAFLTKVAGSGGCVDLNTCKEQLLYEIEDPSAYVTPDCVADFTEVTLQQTGDHLVKVSGGRGCQYPQTLKVSLGVLEGFIGEGEISYAGSGAYERAKLAAETVKERLRVRRAEFDELRVDFIGVNSLHGPRSPEPSIHPYEVRLRVAARTSKRSDAESVGNEVENLYSNGPAGCGGARTYVRQVLAIYSAYVAREAVSPQVVMEEVK